MSLDAAISKALRALHDYAGGEKRIEKLHELLVEINRLIDTVERRVAELQGPDPSAMQ